MNEQKDETVLDEAAIEVMRADAKSIITGARISQSAAAQEANIAPGTFNAWLGGTYKGDNAKVAADVAKWLEARRQRNRIKSIVPTAPSFIETKTAREILDLLQFAQTLKDMGLIVGSPGVGKTDAVAFYRATRPNVFVATMEPAKSSVHHLLLELATTLRISEKSAIGISDAVVKRLRDRDALLVFDEAQHLQSSAIDQVRTIHDKAGCGVVLVGNESVVAKLGDPVRTPQLAQLYSRIGLRLNLNRPKAADVDALLAAWDVTDKEEKQFLRQVANKPGALRALTKTLVAAGAMSAGHEEARSLGHIRDAWSRVGAGPIGNS